MLKIMSSSLLLLLLVSVVSAGVLVEITPEEKVLGENEIGFVTIGFLNNGNQIINNYYMRLEASEGMIFPENKSTSLILPVAELKPFELNEMKVKVKVLSTKKENINLLVYYGEQEKMDSVIGGFVTTQPRQINVKTNVKKISGETEKVILSFQLTNHTGEDITKIAAEVIAPNYFEIKTEPLLLASLPDNNLILKEFEILAPLSIDGEQEIVLSYGYFDSNGPHYFEENFTLSYDRGNPYFLGIIGVIILIIAVVLYLNRKRVKNDEKHNVKGTKKD